MKLLLIALGFVASFSVQALDIVERPVPVVGQVMEYAPDIGSIIRTYTVTAVYPNGNYDVTLSRSNGTSTTLVYDKDNNLLESGGRRYSPKREVFRFPLKAGQTYTLAPHSYPHPRKPDITVTATPTIESVTADKVGNIEALRVEIRIDYRLSNGYSNYMVETDWFTPNGRVKIKSIDYGNRDNNETLTLVRSFIP